MTILKNKKEIKNLEEGGKILASILFQVVKKAKVGAIDIKLDSLAEKLIKQAGGRPSFKGYKTKDDKTSFPASLCISINNEVVHGIPSGRILKNGDIVSFDLGMEYKKLYTDTAVTVPIGEVKDEAIRIINIAKQSLSEGINSIRSGAHIGDIGFAIQTCVEKNGFGVVRKLVGHGLGRKPHDDPEVPNFGEKGTGITLMEGMVLAIEPMITAGNFDIFLDKDTWTWKTKDGSLSTHFEHTIIVTKSGAEIVTKK